MQKLAKKPRVLIVDDEKDVTMLFNQYLKSEFEIMTISTGREALELIKKHYVDVILIDINLPDISGLEVLNTIRQNELGTLRYTGTVIITSYDDKSTIEKSSSFGADSFCNKVRALTHLLPLTKNAYRIKKMTDQLKINSRKLYVANKKLEKLSITDGLTGLYNMRYIFKRLNEEFVRSNRYRHPLSVIMMDIDNFKLVNDNADHLFGSFVIEQVGKDLKLGIREVDIAGRYGGDEFIIILPETDLEGAVELAKRLKNIISKRIYDNGLNTRMITISQGVSSYRGRVDSTEEVQTLIRKADQGLYRAKEGGKNCIYSTIVDSSITANLKLAG